MPYSPNRKPPAPRTQRAIGELLFELRDDHEVWRYELFDAGEWGIRLACLPRRRILYESSLPESRGGASVGGVNS